MNVNRPHTLIVSSSACPRRFITMLRSTWNSALPRARTSHPTRSGLDADADERRDVDGDPAVAHVACRERARLLANGLALRRGQPEQQLAHARAPGGDRVPQGVGAVEDERALRGPDV